ncbi:MAG: ABC transporter [Hamadaea sp.]|uniref:ABC transporter n=1 Tax=Hamadaea sp. NPDC050747 TaxID=3155789 RepID=UPI0017B02D69|nr:ABC transporter [Hamadaea sp.]NUT08731.1 ABC transporter [Hamadaea sp.]
MSRKTARLTPDRAGGAQRADAAPTPSSVHAKVDTLRAVLDTAGPYLPADRLAIARAAAARASARLELSLSHTTVALAGTTGSGKSSMFNAFTSLDRSPVGVLRPTTAEAYACVWGDRDGGEALLDWLGVQPRRRFTRESALDGDDEVGLRGMVLLDLPDVDSIQPAHRAEVDRLLELVDVVVWVTDPQKYSDLVVHDGYLRRLATSRGGFIVALNQTDRLLPANLPQVATDLRRLLDEGGLTDVPLVATSATDEVPGPPARPRSTFRKPDPARSGPLAATGAGIPGFAGIRQLRELLEPSVAGRRAVLERLDADLVVVLEDLVELFGGPAPVVSPSVLADGFHRANGSKERLIEAAEQYAQHAAYGLPKVWFEAITEAATLRAAELPAALERASERVNAFDKGGGWRRAVGAVVPGLGRKAQEEKDRRTKAEYARVAESYVIAPVRDVVTAYSAARAALMDL